MDKDALLRHVLDRLSRQLETMRNAARRSHDAATGSESKAEGKYDTRGLEASYLAGAQADQCGKIAEAIHALRGFTAEATDPASPAQAGSVVEVETRGEISHYFLLPCGGGLSISAEGIEITTLSPETPLYQALLHSRQGDLIEPRDLLVLDVV